MNGERDCATCSGSGSIGVARCGHIGCCPCGVLELPCEDCNGLGKEVCEHCGEVAASIVFEGDFICAGCASIAIGEAA